MIGRSLKAALIAAVVLLAGTVPATLRAGEPTSISLRPLAAVHHETVVIGDVADVSGGSSIFIRRLKGLDLTMFEEVGGCETITARHLQARLLLEGIDLNSVSLTGAEEAIVTMLPAEQAGPVATAAVSTVNYQDDVLSQAISALSRSWLAPTEDVEVQILSSQSGMQPNAGSLALPELELPTRLEPGRIQARLKWVNDGKLERIEQLTLEARLRQTVVLATHNIDRGVPLTPRDVVEDRRLLSNRVEQLSAEQVVGTVAKRGLTQGDLVTARDLVVPRKAPAIQARRGVRVVAKKGSLSVTLQMAEALEPGNVGDVIRLRNIESGRIISGRVVSSQEVEIPLD
jgi:flagella basal body P-ring formation protein FlgA